MAITTISDVFIPAPFTKHVDQEILSINGLIGSPAVAADPRIGGFLSQGGQTFTMPRFKDISRDADEIGDDTTSELTVKKRQSQTTIATRFFRTNGWGNADLVNVISGERPLEGLGTMVAANWQYNMQRVLLAQLRGAFKSNDLATGGGVDAFDGDMSFSAYNDVVSGSITDGNRISPDAIIETKFTLGDRNKEVVMMIMHSTVAKQLAKLEPNDFIPKSSTQPFSTYMGNMVLEDDDMTVIAGVNSPAYVTYFFGPGSIGFGMNAAGYVPDEVDRAPGQGNGAGVERLYTRRDFSLHPHGFSFVGSIAGETAANSELDVETAWTRIFDRKEIKIARLVTNG